MIALAGIGGKLISFLRGVPGWFWMGLAALVALYLWGNHREAQGFDRGERSRDAEVVALVASVAKQNAAVAALKAAGDAAIQQAATARQKAQDERKANAALSARLKAAGGSTGRQGCPVSDLNVEAIHALAR